MLTVLTLNLRFDNPGDGQHAWPHRREAVGNLLRAQAPLLLGTQEGLADQLEELQAQLPGYASFGMARGSPEQDEHCRVFYLTNALRLRRHGDFWLSETPDQPGSRTESWGNGFPRIATWGEFEPIEGGAPFTFLNTHLDHASPVARERAAEQIVRFLRQPDVAPPAIVCGDMNAAPDSLPLRLLLGAGRPPSTASPGAARSASTTSWSSRRFGPCGARCSINLSRDIGSRTTSRCGRCWSFKRRDVPKQAYDTGPHSRRAAGPRAG
jgi:endonuclease/exonuclease/phosphatase family metal-dependent hydrolase